MKSSALIYQSTSEIAESFQYYISLKLYAQIFKTSIINLTIVPLANAFTIQLNLLHATRLLSGKGPVAPTSGRMRYQRDD